MPECQNCAALESLVRQQQQIIEKQNRRIECLGRALKLANEIITNAAHICFSLKTSAQKDLDKGGIPKGRWSYLTGQRDTAGKIEGALYTVQNNC